MPKLERTRPAEFERFEDATKRLLNGPKREVDEAVKREQRERAKR